MKLTAVHRALRFNQRAWLKPYIDLNTSLRKVATTTFENKLMNNCVFGKTMENVRKRAGVDFVMPNEEKRMSKLVASPFYQGRKIFKGGLIVVHSKMLKLILNRPVYVGQAVLDLSKHLMYSFWNLHRHR